MRHILNFAVATSLALLLAVATVFGLNWLDARHQKMVTHVNQQPHAIPAYPVVLAHTIVDRSGDARIIMLHRLTRPMPAGAVPFQWVDLLAIDSPDRQLRCVIDGKPVRIGPAVKVFWAVDGGPPRLLSLSNTQIVPTSPASTKWHGLVGSSRGH